MEVPEPHVVSTSFTGEAQDLHSTLFAFRVSDWSGMRGLSETINGELPPLRVDHFSRPDAAVKRQIALEDRPSTVRATNEPVSRPRS